MPWSGRPIGPGRIWLEADFDFGGSGFAALSLEVSGSLTGLVRSARSARISLVFGGPGFVALPSVETGSLAGAFRSARPGRVSFETNLVLDDSEFVVLSLVVSTSLAWSVRSMYPVRVRFVTIFVASCSVVAVLFVVSPDFLENSPFVNFGGSFAEPSDGARDGIEGTLFEPAGAYVTLGDRVPDGSLQLNRFPNKFSTAATMDSVAISSSLLFLFNGGGLDSSYDKNSSGFPDL